MIRIFTYCNSAVSVDVVMKDSATDETSEFSFPVEADGVIYDSFNLKVSLFHLLLSAY